MLASSKPRLRSNDNTQLLGELLRDVSRSFYLSLRVLPAPLRQPMGTAYLLARAADTLADTALLAPEQRLRQLHALRQHLLSGTSPQSGQLDTLLLQSRNDDAETRLLRLLPRVFALLQQQAPDDQAQIRKLLATLTRGMEQDLVKFPQNPEQTTIALADEAELDEYTYLVAGCVGEFWSEIAAAHLSGIERQEHLRQHGIRYGQALQMINILRDLGQDLRLGRCYLPRQSLAQFGLSPATLPEAPLGKRRELLIHYVEKTLQGLEHARVYVAALPRRHARLRLASSWPLLIGLATLEQLLRQAHWPNGEPAKIGRGQVYRILLRSLPAAFSNHALNSQANALRRRVEQALHSGLSDPAP